MAQHAGRPSDKERRLNQDIEALVQAHQMEVRVLYEALERALSHFASIGGEQAERAASEIADVFCRGPASAAQPSKAASLPAPSREDIDPHG